MPQIFVVEDDFHAEQIGKFKSESDAWAKVRELNEDPSSIENRPPCENWKDCRREYFVLTYDVSAEPWRLVSSEPALTIVSGVVTSTSHRLKPPPNIPDPPVT